MQSVNRELVCLYWHIGRVIVQQQETANWGDAVVEQLSVDLRAEFSDMVGLASDNLWRMRKFFLSCRDMVCWLNAHEPVDQQSSPDRTNGKQGTLCPQLSADKTANALGHDSTRGMPKLDTLSPQIENTQLQRLIGALSWSHHRMILGVSERADERYFYVAMSVRERWSVRELRRQIDADLFTRYVSVKRDPEKCPFRDRSVAAPLKL